MNKHTPGPWNHGRMLLSPKTKDRRCGFVINGPDESDDLPTRICDLRVPRGVSGFSEGEANARLIASAPDLLAALEAWVDSTSLADETGSMRPVYLAARAAIAKATGDSADNAGCDNCGTFYRVEGSKLCEHCNDDERCEHTGMTRDELESICGTSEPKITKVHKVFTDGSCVVDALFDDGEDRHLFSYYIDELDFSDADLIGLTEMEAHKLRSKRDTEYLRS